LFFQDHKDFESTLSNFWTEFKKRPSEFIIAAAASLLQALFTYDIWTKLLQVSQIKALMLPSYFPFLFSGAFFFGTFVLLGHDLVSTEKKDSKEIPTWKAILLKAFKFEGMSTARKAVVIVAYALTAAALFSLFWYSYLPSTLATIPQTWSPQLRYAFVGILFASISFCEVIFNLRSIGSALGVKFSDEPKSSPKLTPSALFVGLIIALNAAGNGFIGIGESTLNFMSMFFLSCNTLMSSLVMYNSNLEGDELTFSHHIQSIKTIPKANIIIPLTWVTIASLWLLPSIPMTSMTLAIYTGICTIISLGTHFALDPTPTYLPLSPGRFGKTPNLEQKAAGKTAEETLNPAPPTSIKGC
jgi:hypothetical protein